MASKSTTRGGGPGSYDSHSVRSTMSSPWKNGLNKGSQGTLNAPFDAGRSGGDNGLPTVIYDSLGGPAAAPAASTRDSLGPVLTNPKGPRR